MSKNSSTRYYARREQYDRESATRQVRKVFRSQNDVNDGIVEQIKARMPKPRQLHAEVFTHLRFHILLPLELDEFYAANPEFVADHRRLNRVAARLPKAFTAFLGEATIWGDADPDGKKIKHVGFRFDYATGMDARDEREPFVEVFGSPPELRSFDPGVALLATRDYASAVNTKDRLNEAFEGQSMPLVFGPVRPRRS